MRILLVHNYYQSSSPSGEDVVFDNERQLLESAGHEVICYSRRNDDISSSILERAAAAGSLFWSLRSYREISALIKKHQPQVAHFHNTFPLISTSAYAACRDNLLPVVQTLHNYRLICPSGLLLRNGRPCEKCIGNQMLPAIQHACYRQSRIGTALVAGMLNINRALGTYERNVDRYVCLTEGARQRFIRGGLPPEKLLIKPNVLRDAPGIGSGDGGYALYVGRLTSEKGVTSLVDSWRQMNYPLKIAGDGALRTILEQTCRTSGAQIEFLGFRSRDEITTLMQRASLLIIPSECYEGFPMTVLEGLATGTPLLVSALGALDELVQAPEHGYKFKAGDPDNLREKATALLANTDRLQTMRLANRALFDRRYSLKQSIGNLEHVYQEAIACRTNSHTVSIQRSVENNA
jgi:glycosyltransferase involved in cell wall biosynthesis